MTFPSRKAWSEHDIKEHRQGTTYKCFDCDKVFYTVSEFENHAQVVHTISNRSQLTALLVAAAQNKTETASLHCPLCLTTSFPTIRKFTSHVCAHMEDIALSTLPQHDSESDAEGPDSEFSDRSSASDTPQIFANPSNALDRLAQPIQEYRSGGEDEGVGNVPPPSPAGSLPHPLSDSPTEHMEFLETQQPSPDQNITLRKPLHPELVGFYEASPPQQKQMLGEIIYRRILDMTPENFAGKLPATLLKLGWTKLTGKTTGMMLEMDNKNLLDLYVCLLRSEFIVLMNIVSTGQHLWSRRSKKPLMSITTTCAR